MTASHAGCLDGTNLLSDGQYRGCPHTYLSLSAGILCGGDRSGCCQASFNIPVPTTDPSVTVEAGANIPVAYPNCNNPFIQEEPAYCKPALWLPWDCPTFQCEGSDSCVCNEVWLPVGMFGSAYGGPIQTSPAYGCLHQVAE